MTHRCPVESCDAQVKREIFMCARHWRMVPRPLQQAVYSSFERDGRLSDNHREAVRVVDASEAGRKALDLPPGTKALTLWQPWATLIAIGAKPYEFRRWNFTDKPNLAKLVGQRIVIHAGARQLKLGEIVDIHARIAEGDSALIREIALPYLKKLAMSAPDLDAMAPRSVALCTCTIGQPQKSFDLFKHIVADSDRLDHQMWAWPISDVVPFERPIPAVGAQGFWNWS